MRVTPPGVFAAVSKALAYGFKSSVPVVMGIVVGDLLFLLLAIYGLSAIAETFGTLFVIIKYLGAAYLIWLGVRLWRTYPRNTDVAQSKYGSGKYSFLGGLSITLGNPKVILFYMSFLPSFVNLNALTSIELAIIACIVSFVLSTVLLFYAFTASRAKVIFDSDSAKRRMNRVSGSVMIGSGVILLSKP